MFLRHLWGERCHIVHFINSHFIFEIKRTEKHLMLAPKVLLHFTEKCFDTKKYIFSILKAALCFAASAHVTGSHCPATASSWGPLPGGFLLRYLWAAASHGVCTRPFLVSSLFCTLSFYLLLFFHCLHWFYCLDCFSFFPVMFFYLQTNLINHKALILLKQTERR